MLNFILGFAAAWVAFGSFMAYSFWRWSVAEGHKYGLLTTICACLIGFFIGPVLSAKDLIDEAHDWGKK